jgi:hypothetical protein
LGNFNQLGLRQPVAAPPDLPFLLAQKSATQKRKQMTFPEDRGSTGKTRGTRLPDGGGERGAWGPKYLKKDCIESKQLDLTSSDNLF